MFTPNSQLIFENSEVCDKCHELSCSNLVFASRTDEFDCDARKPDECPKTKLAVDQLNQFIADNEDLLVYINCGE